MKLLQSFILGLVTSSAALAADLEIGRKNTVPGATVEIPVTIRNAEPGLSAFAAYVTWPSALSMLSVTSAGHPSLTIFADDFGNGVQRITGFMLDDAALPTGIVASLTFTVPNNVPVPTNLLLRFVAPPTNAIAAPSPEFRTLGSNVVVMGIGKDGAIQVRTAPPPIGIVNTSTNGTMFSADGTPDSTYHVETSTNLIHWSFALEVTADKSGRIQWLDKNSGNEPMRFFRLRLP